jgi:hypothetical protein
VEEATVAELTIRLQTDPRTGKKSIIVRYRSDEDALPLEHEEEHRLLVEKLIQKGAIKAGDAGRVVIEREGAGVEVGEERSRGEDEREERGLKQGS